MDGPRDPGTPPSHRHFGRTMDLRRRTHAQQKFETMHAEIQEHGESEEKGKLERPRGPVTKRMGQGTRPTQMDRMLTTHRRKMRQTVPRTMDEQSGPHRQARQLDRPRAVPHFPTAQDTLELLVANRQKTPGSHRKRD